MTHRINHRTSVTSSFNVHRAAAPLALAVAMLCMSCGARTDLAPTAPLPTPSADVPSSTDVPSGTDVPALRDVPNADTPPVNPGRPCGCPGTPSFQICQLPFMCCPVTRTCENPARFNCSGNEPPPCR